MGFNLGFKGLIHCNVRTASVYDLVQPHKTKLHVAMLVKGSMVDYKESNSLSLLPQS